MTTEANEANLNHEPEVSEQSNLNPDTTGNTSEAHPATTVPDNVSEVTQETVTEDQDVTVTANVEANDEPEAFVIDAALVAALFIMLTAATSSKFYMGNPKRVKLLKEALAIPVSDDKSFTMFYSHAEKDLIATAYRDARNDGGTPADVTNVQVIAEAQARYKAKHGKLALINEEYMV